MRFFPIPDVDFYTEIPPLWSYYCCQPDRKWKQVKYERPHYISYWRELDIIKKDKEKKKMEDARKRRDKEIEEERKKKMKENKKGQMKEKTDIFYRSPPREDRRKKEKKKPKQMDDGYENWPKTRIRTEACLPIYYCTGNRFIRLEKADPLGFKCAPLPISLAEALENKARIKAAQEQGRAAAKAERARKRKERRDADEKAWRKCSGINHLINHRE
uniref:Uncharacterized protein n=1 Tax=Glossina austeni TaxID=7395 RepID=A0A1A9V0R0_GLOAU